MAGVVLRQGVESPVYAQVINGALVNPSQGKNPAADKAFVPMAYIWQLVASSSTATIVTVTKTLGGVTSVISTISVPANGYGSDSFEREPKATYKWSATVPGVTVEVG